MRNETHEQQKWDRAWGNATLAREAARDVATSPRPTMFLGSDLEAMHGDGPSREATAREHFAMAYSERRAQRREMLDVPPGVGV